MPCMHHAFLLRRWNGVLPNPWNDTLTIYGRSLIDWYIWLHCGKIVDLFVLAQTLAEFLIQAAAPLHLHPEFEKTLRRQDLYIGTHVSTWLCLTMIYFVSRTVTHARVLCSLSRNCARMESWFSLSRFASLDRFAARLFFTRRFQYLSSCNNVGWGWH